MAETLFSQVPCCPAAPLARPLSWCCLAAACGCLERELSRVCVAHPNRIKGAALLSGSNTRPVPRRRRRSFSAGGSSTRGPRRSLTGARVVVGRLRMRSGNGCSVGGRRRRRRGLRHRRQRGENRRGMKPQSTGMIRSRCWGNHRPRNSSSETSLAGAVPQMHSLDVPNGIALTRWAGANVVTTGSKQEAGR